MIYNGVDLFTIAKVIEDSGERYEAETPVLLPVSSIELPDEGSFTPVYKDGTTINAYAIGVDQEIVINTGAISPAFLNEVLNGKAEPAFFDTGVNITNFYAISFRLTLYDGSYTYYSYLKGTITLNSKSVDTAQETSAAVESITFRPLVTRHKFTYNGKPCRKVEVNTNNHNVNVEGWLAIQWTPNNFLPVPAPIIEVKGTPDNIEVTLLALRSNDTIRYTLDGATPTLESEEYNEPIIINKAVTIKAIECATCKHTSAVAVREINILLKPIISYVMLEGETPVDITSQDEGVIFRYTTNGEEPTPVSEIFGTLTLYKNTTIKAFAEKTGFINSAIATEDIEVRLPTPVLKRSSSGISDMCIFTIDNKDIYTKYGDVEILIYKDGQYLSKLTPNMRLSVSSNDPITVIASVVGNVDSYISNIGYPDLKAQAPIIEPYLEDNELKVKIYSKTLGCNIYYTLDGTEPDETSTLYNGSFAYNGEKIKARAYRNEILNPSDVSEFELNLIGYNNAFVGFGNDILSLKGV